MFLPTHKEIEMNSKVQNGTLYLSGDITVKTVNVVAYQQFQQACQQNIHTLDLAGVTQADSACISLLLAAPRQALCQHLDKFGVFFRSSKGLINSE